jgi:4-alpha-glucanotransferase
LFKTLDKNTQAALNRLYEDFFYRRHNDFWKQQALNKLPALLEATKMLVCGEDLGMVPNSVPEVMAQLQILSLEIQRMPKEFGVEFIDPHATPYLSVNSTGSHDMSTLRGWWKEDKEKIQRYFNQMLHREGVAPDDCTSDLALQIITQQMEANSMWTILPLQDYLAISDELKSPDVEGERINNPSDPNHFWCYRMHLCLEDLIKADALNEKLRTIIVEHRN